MATLRAFYDLKVCPCTFDVVTFLYLADMYRRHLGFESLELLIVANDDNDGFRSDSRHIVTTEYNLQVLNNVLMKVGTLVPACTSTTFCPDRSEAALLHETADAVYPCNYTAARPVANYLQSWIVIQAIAGYPYSRIKAPSAARERMKRWIESHCGGRQPVVITLRELGFHTVRNSSLAAWGDFARWLDPQRYCPVILHDTHKIFEPSPPEIAGLLRCDMAALDVELRAALYELAYLCLFVNNGPIILARLNPSVRYVIFGLGGVTPPFDADYLRRLGITRTRVPFPVNDHQCNAFEKPSFDHIRDEFRALERQIDSGMPAKARADDSPDAWMRHFAEFGAYQEAEAIYTSICGNGTAEEVPEQDFLILVENSIKARLAKGRVDDALEGYRLLCRYQPPNPDIVLQIIAALSNLRLYQHALRLVDALPADLSPDRLRGEILLAMGRPTEAQTNFAAHMEQHPDDYQSLIRYAEIMRQSGDTHTMTALLERALTIIPPAALQDRIRAKKLMDI